MGLVLQCFWAFRSVIICTISCTPSFPPPSPPLRFSQCPLFPVFVRCEENQKNRGGCKTTIEQGTTPVQLENREEKSRIPEKLTPIDFWKSPKRTHAFLASSERTTDCFGGEGGRAAQRLMTWIRESPVEHASLSPFGLLWWCFGIWWQVTWR